jgi:AcrR family transcriptional regulator
MGLDRVVARGKLLIDRSTNATEGDSHQAMTTAASSTRLRLIEVAMQLFHSQGYSATGVSQILKEAGARSGSLYHFFASKEDLLIAVLEHYKELLWPMVIDPAFARTNDPIERVFAVLEGYRQALRMTECIFGCPIGNLALELGDSLPKARSLMAENFDGWKAAIQQCLDAARDRLPPDVDTAQLATFILTVMEGGVMQSRTYRDMKPFNDSVALLRDYFDRLMQTAHGPQYPKGKDA